MTKRERNIAINHAITLASNWAQLAERGAIGVYLMENMSPEERAAQGEQPMSELEARSCALKEALQSTLANCMFCAGTGTVCSFPIFGDDPIIEEPCVCSSARAVLAEGTVESPLTDSSRNNADLLAVDMREAIEKLREARDA